MLAHTGRSFVSFETIRLITCRAGYFRSWVLIACFITHTAEVTLARILKDNGSWPVAQQMGSALWCKMDESPVFATVVLQRQNGNVLQILIIG